ncbi:MAG: alpha/beta hydrolase [Candidatus Poribacteria bacterium]|nr:alpha/beta hydrolase [Candidatus Poribacteria bacterium]
MFIEINDLKIAYQVEGTGTPVVLLHGWGGEANSFKPAFDWLSRSYQVYALDLPGFGLSEIPSTAWDASDYAKFLSAFFYKLNIDKAHLIGHSYGGRISIVMAAEEPEKVDKLILVDSAGIIPPRTVKYYIRVSVAKIGRLMRCCGTLGNRLADSIAQRVGSRDYQEAGPMRATLVKSVNQNLRPLLPKIQASTLLIWGENDTDTPISFGKIMEKEIPDAGLVILKDAGHFSYLDQLPQFCEIVTNFLA